MRITDGDVDMVPQGRIVVPAKAEEPGEKGEGDAKGGGRIYTCEFSETETRTPQLHGALEYQELTSDGGGDPQLLRYTELTEARED